MPKTPTSTQSVEERLRTAFAASLMNANAGVKYLDYDSMDEIIEAAWEGFREPAIATLRPDTGDAAAVEREARNLLDRVKHRRAAGDWQLSGDDSKALFYLEQALAALPTQARPTSEGSDGLVEAATKLIGYLQESGEDEAWPIVESLIGRVLNIAALGQEMLRAFAEGVEWTAEQKTAYVAFATALSTPSPARPVEPAAPSAEREAGLMWDQHQLDALIGACDDFKAGCASSWNGDEFIIGEEISAAFNRLYPVVSGIAKHGLPAISRALDTKETER